MSLISKKDYNESMQNLIVKASETSSIQYQNDAEALNRKLQRTLIIMTMFITKDLIVKLNLLL